MQEEWLEIEDFPGYYVSNYGYVRSEHSDRMLTLSPVQYGMPTVGLMRDQLQYRRAVSGLVARAFLDEPEREDFNTPIHLDGDRKNCRVDNLMWRPRWFAVNYHKERITPPFPQWSRDIRLAQTGEIFDNPSQAAQKYGLLERDIHRSLVNGSPVAPYGFFFDYAS